MIKRLSLLLLVLAVMPMVSAGIFVGQLSDSYNLGDELLIDVTLSPSSPTNDFLTVDIVCGEERVEIYRSPFNLAADEERTISVSALLGGSLTGTLMGSSCTVDAVYDDESASSQSFVISNLLEIDLTFDETRFQPGDSVSISGRVTKQDSALSNGFLEISVSSLDISVFNTVNDGSFATTITIPNDASAGEHTLRVRVYEEDAQGAVSNEGFVEEIVVVEQILTDLLIDVSAQNVFPREEMMYTITAYDQSGAVIDEQISVRVYEPGDFEFSSKIVQSGEESILVLEPRNVPGYWKIEASSGELNSKKLFYLEELEEIETSLIGDTLLVTNVGNVPYDGPIEIGIGSAIEVRQLSLALDETKRFRLSAPDGTYLISVHDGREDVSLGNVPLTGNAIGVRDVREGVLVSVTSPLFWFLVIILIAVVVLYIRARNKKISLLPNKKQQNVKQSAALKKKGDVLYGEKEHASIIAVRMKVDHIAERAASTIEQALSVAKKAGGKIYVDGSYRIMLFAPSLTKVESTDEIAVKVAQRIHDIFAEYNNRSKEKFQFGMGVTNGEIVSEKKNHEFKFTTVGNFVPQAKRLAAGLGGAVLLTDSLRRRLGGSVKVAKQGDSWKVTQVLDRDKHSKFLNTFKDK